MTPSLYDRLSMVSIQAAAIAVIVVGLIAASSAYPFLPPPQAIVEEGYALLSNTTTIEHIWITVYEAFIGLAIAALLGIALGVIIGSNATLTAFANPVILALYSVPKIVFLPILMLMFGVGMGPKIANAAVHAIFPILLNSLVATRETNAIHKKLARSLSATPFQTVVKILFPSMVLPVFAGLRLGIGLSFMGALLAELFQSTEGIGYLVHELYNNGNIAGMISLVIVIFLIIVFLNAIMKSIENYLSRWRKA